jgi:hypothetical protein
MSHRLPEYQIESDREGFFIVDEYGEEADTKRYRSHKDAEDAMRVLIAEDLDNYDGPQVPGWEGGFASNH